MLAIYRWEGTGLKEVTEFQSPAWINLADPSTEEITRVHAMTGISREFLTDPLDKDERPRMEIEDEATTVLIFRVPFHEPNETDIPFVTLPLGVILTPGAVVTICSRETSVTATFLDQIRRVCPPADHFRFTFQLLWHAAILYLRYLRDIRQRTDLVEKDLKQELSNAALIKMLNLQKSLVFFATSLKANEIVLNRMGHTRQLNIPEKDLDVLEDVAVEFSQALEMATIHSNILTGTLDAFASVISNNLNNVMKFLTSVTIVLMVPTLVASIYGMNISLPFQHHANAFAITSGLSVLLSIITIIFFTRRRLF